MSLKPQGPRPIPESVRRVAEQVLAEDDLLRIIGDRLSEFAKDEDYAQLYSTEGRPALSPALLLMVTLLQFLENLSDRMAARMVVMRLDWKYALHLPLSYSGFDPSVLCDFRDRLQGRQGEGARRALDTLLAKLGQMGLLKAGGTQRTDSLSVLAAVRNATRLELAMESVRLALRALQNDVVGLTWLQQTFSVQQLGEWADRYARWTQEERLVRERGSEGRAEVQRLAAQAGEDAQTLLAALEEAGVPERLRMLGPVEVLRTLLSQQYERTPEGMRWRQKVQVAGADALATPHDPDARRSVKRDKGWTGYKLQLTETVAEDLPRIITDVQTDPATANDAMQLRGIQERLAARGLLPEEHLADTTYVTGQNMAQSQERGVCLLGPAYPDVSPQAKMEGGLTQEQFEVDLERQQVRCPGGAVSVTWSPTQEHGRPRGIHVVFSEKDCGGCALYERCVASKSPKPAGRHLRLAEHYELIVQRRNEQRTPKFGERYSKRAGVEASLSEGVRAHGLRRARYVGLVRVQVQHLLVAAALDVKRAARWLAGLPRREERPPDLRALRAVAHQAGYVPQTAA